MNKENTNLSIVKSLVWTKTGDKCASEDGRGSNKLFYRILNLVPNRFLLRLLKLLKREYLKPKTE